jgi:hypothetical protein
MREGHHRAAACEQRRGLIEGGRLILRLDLRAIARHSGLSQTGKIERKAGAPRCTILNHNCSHVCIGNAPHY